MAKSAEQKRQEKIRQVANAIAKEGDTDIMVFNYGVEPGFHDPFHRFLVKRKNRRQNLLLFLATEGGVADCAYRISRHLQDEYQKGEITVAVVGWCKSAGTLMCIGANKLLIADTGELGPLDVQIAKADELWERSSGLVIEAAFQKLQQESFKLFFTYLMDIKEQAGRITFKTAAEIAAEMMVGQTKEIFAKVDPLTVGEDYRSNLIAEQYAIRLNLKANNLVQKGDFSALDVLLRGYPSHGFVIDRAEAERLFVHVAAPTGRIAELAQILGRSVLVPRSAARKEQPWLEYLNEDIATGAKAASKTKGNRRNGRSGKTAAAPGSKVIRGRVPVRAEPEGGQGGREAA